MKITATSDLHGHFPELPSGDVLIIAGDCTSNDTIPSWGEFFKWLLKARYKHKILVGGNHDNLLYENCAKTHEEREIVDAILSMYAMRDDFYYLCDSGIEIDGIKFWGSPWTSKFKRINPKCCAFTGEKDKDLEAYFDMIPDDTNILITHSPPWGILDRIEGEDVRHVGSISLSNRIARLDHLTHHFFGHIHEYGGHMQAHRGIRYFNCSAVDEKYRYCFNGHHVWI